MNQCLVKFMAHDKYFDLSILFPSNSMLIETISLGWIYTLSNFDSKL